MKGISYMIFQDRHHAGVLLAERLREYQGKSVVVYALPRGGVVLGEIVAKQLQAPFDLLIPRKIGHPNNPEYAIASVSEKGAIIKNENETALIDQEWFNREVQEQRGEASRRRAKFLAGRLPKDASGKTAIIVDDGIATGLTMKAAIDEVRAMHPASVVLAVPVAPKDATQEFRALVDDVVVLECPDQFLGSIGAYYDRFGQVSDDEVVEIMKHTPL